MSQFQLIKKAYREEKRTPIVILFYSIIFSVLLVIYHYLGLGEAFGNVMDMTIDNNPNPTDEQLGTFFIWLGGVIIIFITSLVSIYRAIKHDRMKYKIKKDERETMHEYIIANAGYNASIIGICFILYVGPSETLGVEKMLSGALVGLDLLILLFVIIFVRIRKRIILTQEDIIE